MTTKPTSHETADVAELRALAEDADAGPWGQTDYYDEDDGCVCHLVHSGDADQFRGALGLQEYNAAFIAAANPAAVLALLDERDALAAKVERVRALHRREVIAVHEFGPEAWCPTCELPYPCPTARALAGAES